MNKYPLVFLLAISFCCFATEQVIAQGPPRDPERMAEMIRKYDKDGDGKLSAEEREAMRKTSKNARASEKKAIKNSSGIVIVNDGEIERILSRFDKNNDGKLSYEEMNEIRQYLRKAGQSDTESAR